MSVLLLLLSSGTFPSNTSPDLAIRKGQAVYIVGLSGQSRDLTATAARLDIERLAKEQFRKKKTFRLASSLKHSDFVFLVLLDTASIDSEELALVVTPTDYRRFGARLDELRSAAIWEGSHKLRPTKEAAKAAAIGGTLGIAALFVPSTSVCKELVSRFHRELGFR